MGLLNVIGYKSKQKSQELIYNKIVIMTDQDVDGFHIKGLLIAAFYYFDLMVDQDNIFEFRTPIVKVQN